MAKTGEITVEVKAELKVDRKTAETCLKLVELYVNQNKTDIIGTRHEDGTLSFEYKEKLW